MGQRVSRPANSRLLIDLQAQTVTIEHSGQAIGFEIKGWILPCVARAISNLVLHAPAAQRGAKNAVG